MANVRAEPAGSIAAPAGELEADLDRLRQMVEASDVEGARAFVKEVEARWPDSDRVRHWARVLAPPVTRLVPGKKGRPYTQENTWLREHAQEYPGCWLAVQGDRLLAADPDFAVVLATVRQNEAADSALFHFQPDPERYR